MDEEKFDFDKENTGASKSKNPLIPFFAVLVLVVLVLGALYLLLKRPSSKSLIPQTAQSVSNTQTGTKNSTASGRLSQGNSDTALGQDENLINSQLNQLNQDLNSVNSSFTDQSQETANASSNNY